MEEILINVFLVTAMFIPPLLIGIWVFGLRKFISKKGKTTITAANWGLSMWADWTVAWEIGKEEGKVPFSAKAFLALHVLVIIEIIVLFII
jgi:hypothetical protein